MAMLGLLAMESTAAAQGSLRIAAATQGSPVIADASVIKISMPDGEFGQAKYELLSGIRNYPYEIKPGQEQFLAADRSWEVKFERGLGTANQRYRLRPGHYTFRQSGKGWELYRSASMETKVIPIAPVALP